MQEAELNIKSNIPATIAELKELKKQIKTVDADSEQFRNLQERINDTQDALKAARTGADNFAEVLGTLPGPIGNIGNAVGGTIQSLKQFGSIKFTDLKASFTDLGKDIIDGGKGIAKLTGLTKIYEVTTVASSKALQFFGVASNTANTAAKALGATLATLTAATGLIAIVALVDILSNAWDNYSKKAERAEEAQKKLNESIIKGAKAALDAESSSVKQTGDLLVAEAKARGANAQEIYKIEQSNRKLLLESQQRYYDEFKNKDSDEARAAIAVVKSTQNEIKVADANFRADQRTARINAAKETEADKERLRKEAEQKEKERNAKSIKDTEEFEKNLQNRLKELFEENKARLTLQKEQGLIDEETYQDKLLALSLTNAETETDRINAQITYTQFLNQQKEERLKIDKEEKDKAKENAKLYADQQIAYNKAVRESWQDLGSSISNSFMQIANLFEKGSDAAKTFAIASVLINAAVSISKINDTFASQISDAKKSISAGATAIATGTAISPVNPIQGSLLIAAGTKAKIVGGTQLTAALANKGAQIASVGISAAAQIAAITSAGKSRSVSTAGGGASAGSTPSYSGGVPSMGTPQIQGGEGINPTAQIAQTIGASQKPIQAYVLSTKVSSQQALDRRTNSAATFS